MIDKATLRGLSTLRDYPDGELDILLSATTERQYAPRAVLWREGEVGRSCILLVSGEVDVLRRSPDGERLLVSLSPGVFVGQIALVDRDTRTATVRAKTACVTLELDRDVFERLLVACSPLALRFQTQIAIAGIRQLRAATDRLAAVFDPAEALRRKEKGADAPAEAPAKAAAPAHRTPSTAPRSDEGFEPLPPAADDVLAYIQAAASEWELSLDDMDQIEAVQFPGVAPRTSQRPG